MADLQGLVGVLRAEGGDLPGVEVKAAAGGLPDSIIPTLCAFANRPGGGTILLDSSRLVVRNPGGLYGLTVDRLGRIGVTSARNANLVRICQYVRLPDGSRAVEALASGIPAVLDALRTAELPPPVFDDDGLRFTVVLRQRIASYAPADKAGSSTAKVLGALNVGPLDVDGLVEATGLTPANIRKRLRELRGLDLVVQHGGPGRATTYERTR